MLCVCVSNDLCASVRKNVMWALCDFVSQEGSEAMNRNFLAHSSRYSCDVRYKYVHYIVYFVRVEIETLHACKDGNYASLEHKNCKLDFLNRIVFVL